MCWTDSTPLPFGLPYPRRSVHRASDDGHNELARAFIGCGQENALSDIPARSHIFRMAIRDIARMGAPILKVPAAAVADPTAPEIAVLVADMEETMAAG